MFSHERSSQTRAKCPGLFRVVKSSLNVRGLSSGGSPEDEATSVRWRRGLLVVYGSIVLVTIAVAAAIRFIL
jgi:hypothetical protein